jgi:hypothetical protein
MSAMKKCRQCGRTDGVRHGLCETCRERQRAESESELAPQEPSIEPMHDRPWVARSAFTRRSRRSPRS